MMTRFLSVGFLLVGLGLLALAAFDYFDYVSLESLLPSDSEPYLLAPADLEVASAKPRKPTEVTVILENHAGQAVKVIGLSQC